MGKKYIDSAKTINSAELYDPAAAVALAKMYKERKIENEIESYA